MVNLRWVTLCSVCTLIAWHTAWCDTSSPGNKPDTPQPSVALIIDDMGNELHQGQRALALPGPVAYAFLPQAAYSRQLAKEAHSHNKEVMLHLPMQAIEQHALEPGAISLHMARQEVIDSLSTSLDAVPHVIGINNHMGSLITRHPGHMNWLMQEILQRGNLFFVDSRTTAATVAERVAQEVGVPNLRRDIFLDNAVLAAEIERQFSRLLAISKQKGAALAIAHPHSTSIRFLEQELPRLAARGVRLIPVSELVSLKNPRYISARNTLAHNSKHASPIGPTN